MIESLSIIPDSPTDSGLFHSQENDDFVGALPRARPPHPRFAMSFRDWGSHGGQPLQENETALPTDYSPSSMSASAIDMTQGGNSIAQFRFEGTATPNHNSIAHCTF